jgi:hypothetical protein
MERAKQDAKAGQFLDSVKATLTDRATTYPPYSEEAEKVAKIWNALKPGTGLSREDVALFMLIVKLVRLGAGNSPDSLVDLVGYAARLEGMQAD